jgi:hypothetical protein
MKKELYRLGFDVFGPVLATFARLLLEEAERKNVKRLAFVARDGHYLREVTARFIQKTDWPSPPELEYIYLSRMVTVLPQYGSFAAAVAGEADSLFGARGLDVSMLLRYFALDPSRFETHFRRHGYLPEDRLNSLHELKAAFDDEALAAAFVEERGRQRELLGRYLDQEGVTDATTCALVDLGWRGSTPAALARAFPDRFGDHPLLAFQLGYWDERGPQTIPQCAVNGILSDCRRGRTLLEGAAFYAAYLLEALCRAPHGTVIGFERQTGPGVRPVLALALQRDLEEEGESWRQPIRAGVADFIDREASHLRRLEAGKARSQAQRLLFRIAFFPKLKEVESVAGLGHTEGYAPTRFHPLVSAERPFPLASPRRWLSGLASPWRGGYVRVTGGWPASLVWASLESLLVRFPLLRRSLRRLALAFSSLRASR